MERAFYVLNGTLLLISLFLWIFFSPPLPPVKIGLLVSVSGNSPELGREIRDGAFLAVEEINSKGGIKGRKIRLIIKDNQGNSETAKINLQELIKEEVVAIVGPSTSTMAKHLLPIINEHKVTVISPTVSSTYFSEKDDYFITLEPNNKKFAKVLAKYVNEEIKPKKFLILYDKRNPVYTTDFAGNFTSFLNKSINIKYLPIPEDESYLTEIENYKPDTLMLVTDVFNASFITQKVRKIKPHILIIICPWARFHGFIENTGYLSTGVISIGLCDEDSKDEKYIDFVNKFIKTFGYFPESAAINGYNAILLIKEALQKGKGNYSVKDSILRLGKFEGICGEVRINKYGDSETEPFIVVVEGDKFIRVK